MKIAVNTRLLLKDRLDGIGWFSFETLRRITVNHPEHDFYFLFDRPYDREFIFSNNIIPVILRPPARHPVLWFLWIELSVNRFLKRNKIDLFISPDGFIPLLSKIPAISIIHDINFFHRPGDLPLLSRLYYNFFFPRFASHAVRVGTVSEYSAEDISRSYNTDRDKIDIYHNGVNSTFRPLNPEEIQNVRKRTSKGHPYFVYIGTLHPRKNVANLLRAFDKFKQNSAMDMQMVIVGDRLFRTGDIDKVFRRMEFRKDVIFTGRLNAENLMQVLAASLALIFVPYFEGFGIPVIEAMKCGVPVVVSRVTSLPEIGGEAVLYSDPDDIQDIAENMKRIAENEGVKQKLIQDGFERAGRYSWDKTAEKLWHTVEKVIYES